MILMLSFNRFLEWMVKVPTLLSFLSSRCSSVSSRCCSSREWRRCRPGMLRSSEPLNNSRPANRPILSIWQDLTPWSPVLEVRRSTIQWERSRSRCGLLWAKSNPPTLVPACNYSSILALKMEVTNQWQRQLSNHKQLQLVRRIELKAPQEDHNSKASAAARRPPTHQ